MKCDLKNSPAFLYFGKNTEKNTMKNKPLNFGVVAPPDKLPNTSLYNTVYSNETTLKPLKLNGGSKVTAGKISAVCAFSAMLLSAISLLPFIRKH